MYTAYRQDDWHTTTIKTEGTHHRIKDELSQELTDIRSMEGFAPALCRVEGTL